MYGNFQKVSWCLEVVNRKLSFKMKNIKLGKMFFCDALVLLMIINFRFPKEKKNYTPRDRTNIWKTSAWNIQKMWKFKIWKL